MSKTKVHRVSKEYIKRQLKDVPKHDHALVRFTLDIADLMTGPTSMHNAMHLANTLTAPGRDVKDVALFMKEAAERYLSSLEPSEKD